MLTLLPPIAIAFLVTLVFMLALRPFAINHGLVDIPGGRKTHVGEVPIVGGVAMFIGMLIGLVMVGDKIVVALYLAVAAGLIVVIGLLDDRYGLSPIVRLCAQVTAVLIMVYGGGLVIQDIGNPIGLGEVDMGAAALIFTVLATLTVINGFNLVDGVDGLAGSLGFVALTAVAIVGGPSASSTLIAAIFSASIVAFLIFNFPMNANRRVHSFMGDSGSTLIGMVIVWTTISVSQGEERIASPVICLWFASISIYDLLTCTVRRLLKHRSPFRPGRDHFHHVLKSSGMGVRRVLGVLTGLQILYASIGLMGHYAGVADAVMFISWAILGLFQYLILKTYSVSYRLTHRRKRRQQFAGAESVPQLASAESVQQPDSSELVQQHRL